MGSPRRGGNSDHLLERALDGARSAGADTDKVTLIDLTIAPCRECDRCAAGELCAVSDDMGDLLVRLRSASGIIVAAPIFFCGVPAHAKAMIDRCQPVWHERRRAPQAAMPQARRGAFILTGGAHGRAEFAGAETTMRAFLAALGFVVVDQVAVGGLESRDDVLGRPEALERAFWAGRRVGSPV
jgi:multimeric flavodoxin WrbA